MEKRRRARYTLEFKFEALRLIVAYATNSPN